MYYRNNNASYTNTNAFFYFYLGKYIIKIKLYSPKYEVEISNDNIRD